MKVIDPAAELKHLYNARRKPEIVVAEAGTFLAVDGRGEPGGEQFQSAVQSLYSAVYTTKFTGKMAGTLDFKIGRLECLYYCDPGTPMELWKWRMLIRIPAEVSSADLRRAVKTVKERKGLDVSAVQRIRWKEGKCVQMMHIGPYNEVGAVYQQLQEYAATQELAATGPGHEVYFNDPHRTSPQKLKTLVRMPVRKA